MKKTQKESRATTWLSINSLICFLRSTYDISDNRVLRGAYESNPSVDFSHLVSSLEFTPGRAVPEQLEVGTLVLW